MEILTAVFVQKERSTKVLSITFTIENSLIFLSKNDISNKVAFLSPSCAVDCFINDTQEQHFMTVRTIYDYKQPKFQSS